jgi:hypothetical protein
MSEWLRRALLEKGLLRADELKKVEAHPDFAGRTLVEKIYRSGFVDDTVLASLFIEQGATDCGGALDKGLPPPAALGALLKNDAERFRALPLAVNRSRVTIGLLDPSDSATLEALSFRTGLVVEPCVIRAGLLFDKLNEAFGIAVPLPDPTPFVIARPFVSDDEISDELPPPSSRLPEVRVVPPREPVGDPSSSPLAAGLLRSVSGDGGFLAPPETSAPTFGWLRDRGPSTPAVPPPFSTTTEVSRVHRDSLPPQVLPFLVPPFRSAVLFLVRKDLAVGWDGIGQFVQQSRVRDVLLPLTAPSAFARAWAHGMVAAGSPLEPTTVEHIFFRFLGAPTPSAFTVLPILVGDESAALLYVDVSEGTIDDRLLANARQVGATLADGLAPLVAQDLLFGM